MRANLKAIAAANLNKTTAEIMASFESDLSQNSQRKIISYVRNKGKPRSRKPKKLNIWPLQMAASGSRENGEKTTLPVGDCEEMAQNVMQMARSGEIPAEPAESFEVAQSFYDHPYRPFSS